MRLRLLDRYVLKELLYPFVFGIAAFSSIFIASTMLFKITQYMTKYGAPLETVARLFMYNLPEVINYTFPMSMLLAALMAFGKLSGSSEITAMKAGGVSYYRIVAPVLVVGFFVSMFSMVWAEKVVPTSKAKASIILNEEIRHNTRPTTQNHIIIKTISGDTQRVTYANKFDEKLGKMTDITIEEFNKGKIARIQTAKEGYWENGSWRIVDGNVFALDDKDGVQSSAKFKEQIIPLNFSPKQISWEQKEPEEMTRIYQHAGRTAYLGSTSVVRNLYENQYSAGKLLLCNDRCLSGHSEAAYQLFYRSGHQYHRNIYLLCNNDLHHRFGQGWCNAAAAVLRIA